ncbi:hypothetical protein [Paraglaciecola hydrolytica]|uniref:Phosphoribosyltransferase domain-containing protein n=1 Tax=Paraglaciecola hydrolytica TaxID=1799789 RepID=A0A148KKH3_9ALTE|nr:hypothetical protein [Paraglaciecola hydrolytica]KXI26796.1 hypothetical protein AX660_03230 [Paraglaciecola hydrolytica]
MAKDYSSDKIYKLCDYPPYRRFGEDNPDRNKDTYRIMDLKNPSSNNHQSAIKHFGTNFSAGLKKLVVNIKTDKIQVAIVPSSKKGKRSSGLEAILKMVEEVAIIYDPLFLVRDEDVPASHEGGNRSIEKHINSISVKKIPDPNIPMLILDDVTTTGNSLEACEKILKKKGVTLIYKVAIGKTV